MNIETPTCSALLLWQYYNLYDKYIFPTSAYDDKKP